MKIFVAATELIKTYGTNDPFELADHLSIRTEVIPLLALKGLIVNAGVRKYIGINSGLPREEQKLVLAHELGHYTLHPVQFNYFYLREHTQFVNGKYERQADLFAFCLLYPKIDAKAYEYAKRLNRDGLKCYILQGIAEG